MLEVSSLLGEETQTVVAVDAGQKLLFSHDSS
jgi:hypothetical protein